jgi:hypothetical protein
MSLSRRELLTTVAAFGVGTAAFQLAVVATDADSKVESIIDEMVKYAEWRSGWRH